MIVELIRDTLRDDVDAVLFIGAAETADQIIDWLKTWVPAEVGDEILMAIVGYLMVKYGNRLHPKVQPVGSGLLVRAVGAYVGDIFRTLIGALPSK